MPDRVKHFFDSINPYWAMLAATLLAIFSMGQLRSQVNNNSKDIKELQDKDKDHDGNPKFLLITHHEKICADRQKITDGKLDKIVLKIDNHHERSDDIMGSLASVHGALDTVLRRLEERDKDDNSKAG